MIYKTKDILKKNIEIISKEMNWESDNLFITKASEGYFTWENKTEDDIKNIFDKTGIQCTLSPSSNILIVPEFNNFKSKREKELLLTLCQFGPSMFLSVLQSTLSKSEYKNMMVEINRYLIKSMGDDKLREFLTEAITKISK